MAFRFEWNGRTLRVVLSGRDRMSILRSVVEIDRANIARAAVMPRHELESRIDHVQLGIGTHAGERRPGRRRVGIHLGRDVVGQQFWVTAASGPELPLLVLDLIDHQFKRAVLAVSDLDVIEALLASDSSGDD